MDNFINEIFGHGVIETARLAYKQAEKDYLKAVSARDDKAAVYYGKQMDILHKAWIALDDNNS